MNIKLNLTSQEFECANCLLKAAIDSFKNNPSNYEKMDLTKKDIENAKKFRQKLIKSIK